MQIHVHLHHYGDPAQAAALERIALAVERVADQNDNTKKVTEAANQIEADTKELGAVVKANPDPDRTD